MNPAVNPSMTSTPLWGGGDPAGDLSAAHSPAPEPAAGAQRLPHPGRDRSLLIDTGFHLPECRQALRRACGPLGRRRTRWTSFSPTSTPTTRGWPRRWSAPGGVLYMGEGLPFTRQAYEDAYWVGIDQRFLREGFPVEEAEKATQGTNPARNLGPTLDLPNYRMVKDGEVLTVGDYTLQVIATPGHTPGQLCLWLEAAGILFTADHVLFDITPQHYHVAQPAQRPGPVPGEFGEGPGPPGEAGPPGHRHTGDLEARIQALFTHHRNRVGSPWPSSSRSPALPPTRWPAG